MSTPSPIPPVKKALIPASTLGAGTAGSIAAGIIYLLGLKGITFPAGAEAALAAFFTTLGAHLTKIFQLRA
jgi:hypothetical protein